MLYLFSFILCFSAFAETMIVRTKMSRSQLSGALKNQRIEHGNIESLSQELGIYSVQSPNFISPSVFETYLDATRRIPGVFYASKNSFVKHRQSFRVQKLWNFDPSSKFSSKAEAAWKEFGFPSRNKLNQEVVVGIIEGGKAAPHRLLNHAYWINKGEIPGNGIDDDKNGYIDDVSGIGRGAGDHTTHVAGIIASSEFGIAKNVKVISVDYNAFKEATTTAAVIKASEYFMALKRRWFFTNGREGANIVSINSSFGLDRKNCMTPNYIAWNDIYNELGRLGILSAVATTNELDNVDQVFDVPSTCTSSHLIGVGNINSMGSSEGGYGQRHVDLFAQGTDILSTVPGDKTEEMTGTSMATPHVAGAIGYLHTVAPVNFTQFYMRNPMQASYDLKMMLLKSTSVYSFYRSMNAESGVLNLSNAAKLINGKPIQRYDF